MVFSVSDTPHYHGVRTGFNYNQIATWITEHFGLTYHRTHAPVDGISQIIHLLEGWIGSIRGELSNAWSDCTGADAERLLGRILQELRHIIALHPALAPLNQRGRTLEAQLELLYSYAQWHYAVLAKREWDDAGKTPVAQFQPEALRVVGGLLHI